MALGVDDFKSKLIRPLESTDLKTSLRLLMVPLLVVTLIFIPDKSGNPDLSLIIPDVIVDVETPLAVIALGPPCKIISPVGVLSIGNRTWI